MSFKNKNTRNNKRTFAIVFLAASAIAIGLILYVSYTDKDASRDTGQRPVNSINYDPPTNLEQKTGDEVKKKITEEYSDNKKPKNNDTKTSISVIITDANQYDSIIEVRSFLPNHYEDGSCTITFTKDNHTISRVTPAYRDVSTTICTNPLIKRSDFPISGNWSVSVAYQSANASGRSETQTLILR